MGRLKKDNTEHLSFRIDSQKAQAIRKLAIECGFTYGDGAAVGKFFERLASLEGSDREVLNIILSKDA